MPRTAEEMLAEARSGLRRLEPGEASRAIGDGALIVDIRSDSQRERDGVVPDAVYIPRNVLEWRCDPASDWRDPRLGEPDQQVIVMCNKGYQSSLAAATLKELGLEHATDVVGGFQAWREAGLPVRPAR